MSMVYMHSAQYFLQTTYALLCIGLPNRFFVQISGGITSSYHLPVCFMCHEICVVSGIIFCCTNTWSSDRRDPVLLPTKGVTVVSSSQSSKEDYRLQANSQRTILSQHYGALKEDQQALHSQCVTNIEVSKAFSSWSNVGRLRFDQHLTNLRMLY